MEVFLSMEMFLRVSPRLCHWGSSLLPLCPPPTSAVGVHGPSVGSLVSVFQEGERLFQFCLTSLLLSQVKWPYLYLRKN